MRHWQAPEQDVLDAAAWAAGVPLKLHLVAGILARNAERTSSASGNASSASAGASKAAGGGAGQGTTVRYQSMLSKSASLDMCAAVLSMLSTTGLILRSWITVCSAQNHKHRCSRRVLLR